MSRQLILDVAVPVISILLLLVPRLTRSILLESLLHPFRTTELREANGRIQAVRR